MSRTKTIYLFVGFGICAVGIFAFVRHPREPVLHGQRLSGWFAELYAPVPNRAAVEVIKTRFGSKAVPFLVQELNARDSFLRRGYLRILPELPESVFTKLPHPTASAVRQDLAAHVLKNLGPDAESAIPDLLVALRSPNANIRANAAETLGVAGSCPDTPSVVPDLIATMKDPESRVRSGAASSLGFMGTRALSAKPILIAALKDKDPSVAINAANTLGGMGTNASEAVPGLISLIQSFKSAPGPALLTEVGLKMIQNDLRRIDPEAAARLDKK
jgi:HEAT repeat protein